MPWPIWRLVLAGVATYTEIETQWTLGLVAEANYVLDVKLRIEKEAQDGIRKRS